MCRLPAGKPREATTSPRFSHPMPTELVARWPSPALKTGVHEICRWRRPVAGTRPRMQNQEEERRGSGAAQAWLRRGVAQARLRRGTTGRTHDPRQCPWRTEWASPGGSGSTSLGLSRAIAARERWDVISVWIVTNGERERSRSGLWRPRRGFQGTQ